MSRMDNSTDIFIAKLASYFVIATMLMLLDGFHQLTSAQEGQPDAIAPTSNLSIELLSANTPHTLELVDDKILVRHRLKLRPRAELRALFKQKWVGGPHLQWTPTTFNIPRHDISEKGRQEALTFARAILNKSVDFVSSFLKQDNQKPEFPDRFFLDLKTAREIFQAVGTRSDERLLLKFVKLAKSAELLKSWNALHFSFPTLVSGVRVAMRLGSIEESAFVAEWRRLTQVKQNPLYPPLTIELARWGYRPALNNLVDEVAIKQSTSNWNRHDRNAAFELITRIEHPAVLALSLEIIEAFGNNSQKILQKEIKYHTTTRGGLSSYSAFPYAFGYAAAFAPDDKRHLLAVGISIDSPFGKILPYFEDPILVLDFLFGISSKKFQKAYSLMLCRLAAGRTQSEYTELERRYEKLFYQWYNHNYIKEQYRDSRISLWHWHKSIATAKAKCMVSAQAMQYLTSSNSDPMHRLPAYMSHASGQLIQLVSAYKNEKSSIIRSLKADNFDSIDDKKFAKIVNENGIAKHPDFAAYMLRRKVATSAYIAQSNEFPGQENTRYFVQNWELKADAGGANFWLGGKVNLIPRVSPSRRLFGIKLEMMSHFSNGLVAMMDRWPETLNRLTASHAREMISQVKLRHGNTSSPLEFQRTTRDGIHVFELVEPITSDSNLIVDIYMKGKNWGWVISFPLYASPFGNQQMYRNGQISLK